MHRNPEGEVGCSRAGQHDFDKIDVAGGYDGHTSALLPVFLTAFTIILRSINPNTVILLDVTSISTHLTPVKFI